MLEGTLSRVVSKLRIGTMREKQLDERLVFVVDGFVLGRLAPLLLRIRVRAGIEEGTSQFEGKRLIGMRDSTRDWTDLHRISRHSLRRG